MVLLNVDMTEITCIHHIITVSLRLFTFWQISCAWTMQIMSESKYKDCQHVTCCWFQEVFPCSQDTHCTYRPGGSLSHSSVSSHMETSRLHQWPNHNLVSMRITDDSLSPISFDFLNMNLLKDRCVLLFTFTLRRVYLLSLCFPSGLIQWP